MSQNGTDEELQEQMPDIDETSASLLLNAIKTWERMLGQSGIRRDPWDSIALDNVKGNVMYKLDHSAKRNGKSDKIYKAMEDTFDNGEDDDDIIENMPVSNEK